MFYASFSIDECVLPQQRTISQIKRCLDNCHCPDFVMLKYQGKRKHSVGKHKNQI